MRIGLRAVMLAVLVAGSMCASAWAKPTPDTSFAETSQASAAQYTDPNAGTNPSDQSGNKNQTTCSVVVDNGRLVRVCSTVDSNGNVVRTTRQDLGPAGASASASLATARGGLPFTGLDLTLVLLAGASLVAAGVVIRVGSGRTRRNRSSA